MAEQKSASAICRSMHVKRSCMHRQDPMDHVHCQDFLEVKSKPDSRINIRGFALCMSYRLNCRTGKLTLSGTQEQGLD
eukprot:13225775-Ditylum_brightwellii.AAC.1